jgi:hypothetical protein
VSKRLITLLALMPLGGAAAAAQPAWHTMSVELPDGSIAEVRYVGDIPPRVMVAAPVVQDVAPASYRGIPRARRVIARPEAQPQARPEPEPTPRLIVAGEMPRGTSYEYSLISTDPEGRVCTQRTEWTSRGYGLEPKITHSDIGDGCAVQTGPR